MCLLEELDRDLASDHSKTLSVGLPKQLSIGAFLVWRELENGMIYRVQSDRYYAVGNYKTDSDHCRCLT